MAVKLFLSRDGKTLGPFPEEKIRELYENGKVDPDNEVWPEGGFVRKTTVEIYFGSPEIIEDEDQDETEFEEEEIKPKPKKKKKSAVSGSSGDFGTPDVLFILKNLNDGTFIKNLTGTLMVAAGAMGALGLIIAIGMLFVLIFNGNAPVFATLSRVLLILSLIYPTYFFFVSFINTGIRIWGLKTGNFVMAPIVSVTVDTLANNNLIFGLFITIPLTIFSSAIAIEVNGVLAGLFTGALTFLYCLIGGVGAFFFMKFLKEFMMVFFIIGQDVEVIRTKAEELK